MNLGGNGHPNIYGGKSYKKNQSNIYTNNNMTMNNNVINNNMNNINMNTSLGSMNSNTNSTGGYNQNSNNFYKTNYVTNNLQTTYNDLVSENYDLKNKLNLYKTHFKTQSGPVFLDNDFNNIRNSITQNNKVGFSQAINQLKTNLDNVTNYNYNPIIQARNQEIEKWKHIEATLVFMKKTRS